MHRIAMTAGWAVLAFCTACVSDPTVRPVSLAAATQADRSAEPDRVAHVASRLALALAGVCDCRGAPDVGPSALELCGTPIKIENMAELQASTNGGRIRITTGMLRFFRHEDELAFVLAHELSHILLGHSGSFSGRSPTSAEVEADKLGIRIVSAANFDAGIAANFPLRLAQHYPSMNQANGGYPMPAKRAVIIGAALKEDSGTETFAALRGRCAGSS